ncbi:GH32 C-terminal domain-containing protein [Bifidobacterium crudilactis]|uniref:GH32 C-terminal domain-containing protein n=1 Tax=Bifidobacterium crudilactis TaxID=327277 RepID=UPI002648EE11|nr:GH32 C-terminal domain-containing protein [Bifidobacterium crudilactis]MDN6208840.1 GH32 C-terminal domain-containing protein [Bifidobacterium crudilactis]
MTSAMAGVAALCISAGFVGTATAQTATDFTERPSGSSMTASNNEISVPKQSGDHFITWNESPSDAKAFVYEADVVLRDEGSRSAALLFGVQNASDPGSATWYAANFDKDAESNKSRVFRVAPEQALQEWVVPGGDWSALNFDGSVHLRLQVSENGKFNYAISNTGAELGKGYQVSGDFTANGSSWDGGTLGLLTWESGAVFSHVEYLALSGSGTHSPEGFNNTGLGDFTYSSGYWEYADNGIRGISNLEGTGLHDSFLYSDAGNFTDGVYSSTVTFNQPRGAATMVFRAAGEVTDSCSSGNCSYAANINYDSAKARLFKFENGNAIDLQTELDVERKASYNIEVHTIGKHVVVYIDGVLAFNTADYLLRGVEHAADAGVGMTILGQNDAYMEGKIGLLTFNGDVSYSNLTYQAIADANSPQLTGLSVTANGSGTAEEPTPFDANQYVYIQYVSADTSNIDITAPVKNAGTDVVVRNEGGSSVGLSNLPLAVGKNVFTIETDNNGAKLVYRLMVHRYDPEVDYYDETYRSQYHYSVKEGWANDLNGMVYFNGEYHLFYQFYNDMVWGPMHWAHSVSTDLIHWEDKPIAFYPDEYGAMFSGSAVVDAGNASGLCGEGFTQDCLVAIITADGNGQRVMVASSKDGDTWTKHEGIVKDWSEDGLNNKDFRDPKVFRYQGTWFMVIAGGPLRIYSSHNLVDWQPETLYGDLHTECPDLFMLPFNDGDSTVYKWVLSRGGRTYKIGDFNNDSGKWAFVPDVQYADNDANGVMNLARDAYAAQTYYQGEFVKSEANPEVIAIQWMNTWEDYCNKVAPALVNSGQHFNGSFDLQLKMGLTKDADGRYLLTSTPLDGYQELRMGTHAKSGQYTVVPGGANVMAGFTGNQYEMTVKLTPQAGVTEAGIVVLMSEDFSKGTSITYNWSTKTLAVNRENAHAMYVSDNFKDYAQQVSVKPAEDGSVTLHIFVDRSSVEVFADDYTMAASVQVLPDESWQGLNIWAANGNVGADVEIHPLQGIWAQNLLPAATVSSLTVTSQPTKTIYQNTDTEIDATGLEVTAHMSNGTQRVLEASEYDFDFDFTTAGTQDVTVTLKADGNITTTFQITVEASEPEPEPDDSPVTSIVITTLPAKRSYALNTLALDPTGLVVTATLEDDSTRVLQVSEYQIIGFSAATAGTKPLTISLLGSKKAITARFSVVISNAVEGAPVSKTQLNTMITLAKKAKQAKFTAETWDPMNASLTIANTVKANRFATQSDVDIAYCDLMDTYNALVIRL